MNIKMYDGDYLIVHTTVANVYDDKLIFESIGGYKIEFSFQEDSSKKDQVGYKIDVNEEAENKTIQISLLNFRNPYGAATPNKVKILSLIDGEYANKNIYFSIFCRGLSEDTKIVQASTTFYIK